MATSLATHNAQHLLGSALEKRPYATHAHSPLRAHTLLDELTRIQQQADLFGNNEQDPYHPYNHDPMNKSAFRGNRRPSLPFVPEGNTPSQKDWYAGNIDTMELPIPQLIHNTRSGSNTIKTLLKKRPSVKVNIPSPIKLIAPRHSNEALDDRSNSSHTEDTDYSSSTSSTGAVTIPPDIFRDWNYDELPPMIKKKFFSPLERMRIAESNSERLSSAIASSCPSPASSVIEVGFICSPLPYLRPKTSVASFTVIKPTTAQVDKHVVPVPHARSHKIANPITIDATYTAYFYASAFVRRTLRTYFSAERFDEMIELGFPLDIDDDADGFDTDEEDEDDNTCDNQSLPTPVRPSFPRMLSSRHRVPPLRRYMTLRITLTPWHCRAGEEEIYGGMTRCS